MEFQRDFLAVTSARPPLLHCFGLHEWAMLYRPRGSAGDGRSIHQDLPLRVSQEEVRRRAAGPRAISRPGREKVTLLPMSAVPHDPLVQALASLDKHTIFSYPLGLGLGSVSQVVGEIAEAVSARGRGVSRMG